MRSPVRHPLAVALLPCLLLGLRVGGMASTSGASEPVDFATEIQPLFSDRCALCHGPDEASREAELRVDSPDLLSHKSQNGGHESIIAAGDPARSELIRRITSSDPFERMPPPESNLALSAEEIARITAWVEQGAEWEQHWSLQPIARPAIPLAAADASLSSPSGAPSPSDAPSPISAPSPIDAFVQLRLEAVGLAPNPAADPYALMRRVTMDLTGLPPSPEEVTRFVEDQRPDAYERLVERLLASPAFGERMATSWLDLSRYADTYGYQADVYREVWPWRDWVIQAFASGMPYDQFVLRQLAGDLLAAEDQASGAALHSPLFDSPAFEAWGADREAVLATAFNRLHRQTNEGGSVEEEFRVEYAADRVHTLGTAVLGLTLECARCHDHKYDPISQREYYQLFAFFNQIDESGLYSHFTDAVPTPVVDLPTAEQQRALDAARRAAEAAEQQFQQVCEQRIEAASVDALPSAVQLTGLLADEVAQFRFDPLADEAGIDASNAVADQPAGKWIGQPTAVARPATREAARDNAQAGTAEPLAGGAIQLDGENGFETEVGGDWDWWQPWTIALWMRPAELHQRAVVWHRSRAWTDAGSRGYELLLEEGRLSAALIHFWPGDAVRVRTVAPLAVGRWSHVAVTSDGSGRAAGLRIFVNGRPAEVEVIRDSLQRTIRGGGVTTLAIGNRFRDRGFKGGAVDELRIFSRDLAAAEVRLLSAPERLANPVRTPLAELDRAEVAGAAPDQQDRNPLLSASLQATDQGIREARETLRQRRREWAAARDAVPAIMAMRELDEPRETFVLRRGQYDAPGDLVQADVPRALGALDPSLPRNRLGLARWLTDPAHPLVARVAANRLWQMFFDRPLVATPEDFGMQGEPPTHPELLDYLAATLIADGWDLKRLARRIVTSAAYRRSSITRPEQLSRDSDNRWLARGPSSRWPVEMLRDSALAAAGLLDRRVGGPPVRPYQPPGLWAEKQAGSIYVRDVGSGSHRRSLYTIWKRTSPPPSMMIFDAPGREVCAASRATTETPLQALVLLNDEQYVEASRAVAYNLLRQPLVAGPQLAATPKAAAPPDAAAAQEIAGRLWFRMLGRPATAEEREVVAALVAQQQQRFEVDPESRELYLAVGDFSPGRAAAPQLEGAVSDAGAPGDTDVSLGGWGIDRSAWAAWSVAAQMLMNLDEWVSHR